MTQLTNRTLFTGDNLPILRRIDSGSIDLIYADPPFNSNRNYSAPIGSEAAGAAFRDTWTLSDVDLAWHGELADRSPALYQIISAAGLSHSKGMQAYLISMAVRLIEMKRVLADTGSVYLHCDPTAGAYLKTLMDAIFGAHMFRNEIVWCYSVPGNATKHFPRKHDTILFYAMPNASFNRDAVRVPYSPRTLERSKYAGQGFGSQSARNLGSKSRGKLVEDYWTDIPFAPRRERVGYPTQKPLALLERIITASSNPGDTILDPFCGCATTLVAAEKLDRKWVGIDLSDLAVTLVKRRMERELGGLICDVVHRTDIPARTDQGKIADYRTHKHTLFGRQEGRCEGCRIVFPFPNLTVDHKTPRKQGGLDNLDNLQLLCGACNSIKGTGTMAELRARLERRDKNA